MSRGGPAVHIFERCYEERFGFKPVIQTPDAVQLQRALKAVGEESFPKLVRSFLETSDAFLERHGYSGRHLSATVINAFRLSQSKSRPRPATQSAESYRSRLAAWSAENEMTDMPSLAPLPKARYDE